MDWYNSDEDIDNFSIHSDDSYISSEANENIKAISQEEIK